MKDVLVSLTEDHVLLSRLAQAVRAMHDRLSRNALFDELAKALGGHFAALEYVIVPACSRSSLRGLGSDILIAHMNLKRQLADVLMMERNNAEFEVELLALCDAVEAQADREQLELLPVLRDGFDEAERAYLAAEVEAHMTARVGEQMFVHVWMQREPRRATDMLEEAKVVLSSLRRDTRF